MLIEIDENLVRADLMPDERDLNLLKRKEIWDKRQSAHGARIESKRSDGKGHRPKGFAAETAAATRMSKSQINRVIAKAEGRTRKPKTVEEIIAADKKRAAALAATKERKEAERRAAKELEEQRLENDLAELMGILTPYLSPEEIERVVELAGSVGWRWSEGFTYEGQKYGGEADEDSGADGMAHDDPAPLLDILVTAIQPEPDDIGDIPACLDRRRARP